MKLLRAFVSVGVFSVIATSIGLESKPAQAACNPFGCSQSSIAECNPFGCPAAPMGAACSPFGCSPSPQPQQPQQYIPQQYIPQPQQPQQYIPQPQQYIPQQYIPQPQQPQQYIPQPQQPQQYIPQPQQPQQYIPQPQQPQQQSGNQVPLSQGYNLVGGIWFGPDGKPVSSDRRSGEDQATCIARISFLTLQAYSRSETHGDYRYNRPNGVTLQQMTVAGLENKSLLDEKWRGSQPQVTLRLIDSQEATIRCR